MKPYEHQELAIDQARKSYRKNKRVIMGVPTGGGKTVIAAFIAKSALEKGKTVCILCHRIEIVQQFHKTLRLIGIEPSLIIAGRPLEYGCQIYLGMIETFKRRYNILSSKQLNIELLILDEIHWGAYRSLCQRFDKKILGLTATPKSSAITPLNEYFDDLVYPITITELIDRELLVPAKTYSVEYDFSKLQIRRGEFTEQSLIKEFRKPKLFEGTVTNYKKYALGKKAICYNVNVKHSIAITQAFNDCGVRSVHVDAETSKHDRFNIFKAFRHGLIDVLCNVGIATTGYDEPTIECIIENRATTQLTLHHQMVGRGARPCKKIKKDHFTIIDMGRNYLRHGLYGEEVDWQRIFKNPKEDREKKEVENRHVKSCKTCGAIIPITLTQCPYCDTIYSIQENENLIIEKSDLKEIREYRFQTMPAHLRGRKIGSLSKEELFEYAEHMQYDPRWAYVQLNIRRNRKH